MPPTIEENTITAIDPNKFVVITRESFIKKYGEAAKRLLDETYQAGISYCAEAVSGMKREGSCDSSICYCEGDPEEECKIYQYNQACDDLTAKIAEIGEK